MVSVVEVNDAAFLIAEKQTLDMALDNFTRGGAITAFTVAAGSGPPDEDGLSAMGQTSAVTVSARDMPQPPQMIATIRQLLDERRKQLVARLDELGVTGIERAAARTPPPTPPPAAPPARTRRRA